MHPSLLDSAVCADAANERSDGKAIVLDWPAFERLLLALSATLPGHADTGFVDRAEAALRHLIDSGGLARCAFAQFVAGDHLNVVCAAGTAVAAALPRGRMPYPLPWLYGELRSGRVVCMTNLPQELPVQAVDEAEHCRRTGLWSLLAIPLRIGGRVSAVLWFEGIGQRCSWSPETIARLRIFGEVLDNMASLARSEEEVRQLRQRVWHADRVERVSALTAAIAHELNQPLAAILSNAQAGLQYLARDGGMTQAKTGAIKDILEAVVRDDKRAVETMRGVRAMIRPDEAQRELVDLAEVLGDVQRLLKGECEVSGVRVETCFDADCIVMADRVQMGQVALNLLFNAIAALQEGAPACRVIRLMAKRVDARRVGMSVSDSGSGITSQDLESIFEPFWTTRRDGLGLGLAICSSIVEAHGGRIWAEANPGAGTTFSVELAVASGEPPASGHWTDVPAPVAAPAPDRKATAATQGAMVCVIDDDADVRGSLLRLLDGAGLAAVGYASGDEFLAKPPDVEPACILLDVRMPGLSGPQFQQRLLDRRCASSIIFITGLADVTVVVDAMKLGAADYLRKPVDGNVLLAAVDRGVERHAGVRRVVLSREASTKRIAQLTPREREVMAHVIQGRLNKQIACDLLIAEQTVKQHRGRVMEKMGVHSVADLVRACESAGVPVQVLPGRRMRSPVSGSDSASRVA